MGKVARFSANLYRRPPQHRKYMLGVLMIEVRRRHQQLQRDRIRAPPWCRIRYALLHTISTHLFLPQSIEHLLVEATCDPVSTYRAKQSMEVVLSERPACSRLLLIAADIS